jgi:SAM-dependent methyltransferase
MGELMAQQPIRFDDGAAYEHAMGVWSRLAGEVFLDWLSPRAGQRWIDVGCGNGAFTELLVQRCAPSEIHGIDPSEAQLTFARTRPALSGATLQQGDAMALPYEAGRFDAATMALVIFFVPDPKQGVAEMKRVVARGGTIAAYAWDMRGGGFPFEPIWDEVGKAGRTPPLPPNVDISRMDALRGLWADAGLTSVETHAITVQRTYADFDEFWNTTTRSGALRAAFNDWPAGEVEKLKARVHARLPADGQGRITCPARANAVRGRVPG